MNIQKVAFGNFISKVVEYLENQKGSHRTDIPRTWTLEELYEGCKKSEDGSDDKSYFAYNLNLALMMLMVEAKKQKNEEKLRYFLSLATPRSQSERRLIKALDNIIIPLIEGIENDNQFQQLFNRAPVNGEARKLMMENEHRPSNRRH